MKLDNYRLVTDGSTDSPDEMGETDRWAVFLFVVMFIVVLAGSLMPVTTEFTSSAAHLDGKGDLTVSVTDQNGDPVAGQQVQVLDPETGDVLFEGTTDENGELVTTLDTGEYDVLVGDTTQSTSVDSDGGEAAFQIDTTPPDSS